MSLKIPFGARLSLAAVTGVAMVAIAACGGTPSTSSSPTPTPTTAVKVGNPSKAVTLSESGSSLVLPYLQAMVDPLKQAYPNITLAPAAGGSGKGISDAIAGTVIMGGSDAYLSDAQAQQNPDVLNIPIVVSAQAINYNLPGVTDLKLNGDVLAKIYQGTITKWNDPAIANLNSGVNLPATTIVPVRRVESSGDTFLFTSLLSATNTDWSNGPSFGTTVTWPAAKGELTATGNPGMVQVAKQTPGSIAYVGVSAESAAQTAGLGEAMIQNKAGKFLQPTQPAIAAAVNASAKTIPTDMRKSLIYAAGDQSYPIVNFEYMMVKRTQPDADTSLAVRTFLTFAINTNQGSSATNLAAANFVALPENVVQKVRGAINKIGP
jgi:phosphate transport system substrate-binding protein